jgi:hypothetical protein
VAGGALLVIAVVATPRTDHRGLTLSARGEGGDVHASFSRAAASFAPSKADAPWQLEAASLGRGDATTSLPQGEPARAGRRVEIARGPVIEWYERHPEGIEHGFDLEARPAGEGLLVLRLAVSGARVESREGGQVDVVTPDGVRFAYGKLEAVDAAQRRLPAVLSSDATSIEIRIDDRDAAYPLVVDPLIWRERQSFAPPGLAPNDGFSAGGIVFQGTTAFIGTYGAYTNFGLVAAYERVGNDWVLGQTIVPPDAQAGEGFGRSFALSGDTLAVGAFRDGGPGSVYVFVRGSMGWTQQAKLPSPADSSKFFGWSVAIAGDTLVVSSVIGGAVYVYTRDAGVWTLATTLTGDPGTFYFGSSVALSGTTLLVGAGSFYRNLNTNVPGRAYVFVGSGDTWQLQARLIRPTTEPPEKTVFFGSRVALEGDTAVIPNGYDYSDPPQGGRAYVYTRTGAVWTETQVLVPSDSTFLDGFSSNGDGGGVVLHGDRMLISATGGNASKGEAYLFERSGGVWSETQRFVASDANVDDRLGCSGDFSNDMILMGSVGPGTGRGKVYAFFHGSEGDPCTTGAPCATGHCVDGVCCNTACGGGDTADCMACSIKTGAAADGTCGPTTPHVCRPARSECDAPESCDGENVTCPADLVAANGLVCATGTCSGGNCLAVIPFETSHSASPAPPPAPADLDGGCACRAARGSASPWSGVLVATLLAGLYLVRRRGGRPEHWRA